MLFCLQSRFWDFCSKFRRDNQKLYFLCKASFGSIPWSLSWRWCCWCVRQVQLRLCLAFFGPEFGWLATRLAEALVTERRWSFLWTRPLGGFDVFLAVPEVRWLGRVHCFVVAWDAEGEFWRSSHGPRCLGGSLSRTCVGLRGLPRPAIRRSRGYHQ